MTHAQTDDQQTDVQSNLQRVPVLCNEPISTSGSGSILIFLRHHMHGAWFLICMICFVRNQGCAFLRE